MKTDIRSEKGFTLVELAVVMIIIGLLIGGVLKGQELIKSARITSTISQIKAVDAAVSTFQDIYAALPGDLPAAATRLPGCLAANICGGAAGDGNGTVVNGALAVGTTFEATAGSEGEAFFVHLAKADLISGVVEGNAGFGGNYPSSPVAGGMLASTVDAVGNLPANDTAPTDFRSGLYLLHARDSTDNTVGAVDAITMERIDRKIDDGVPTTGSVYGLGASCLNAAADVIYTVVAQGIDCLGAYRIQN